MCFSPLGAGRSPRCGSVPSVRVGPLGAGRSPRCGSVPSVRVGPHSVVTCEFGVTLHSGAPQIGCISWIWKSFFQIWCVCLCPSEQHGCQHQVVLLRALKQHANSCFHQYNVYFEPPYDVMSATCVAAFAPTFQVHGNLPIWKKYSDNFVMSCLPR